MLSEATDDLRDCALQWLAARWEARTDVGPLLPALLAAG